MFSCFCCYETIILSNCSQSWNSVWILFEFCWNSAVLCLKWLFSHRGMNVCPICAKKKKKMYLHRFFGIRPKTRNGRRFWGLMLSVGVFPTHTKWTICTSVITPSSIDKFLFCIDSHPTGNRRCQFHILRTIWLQRLCLWRLGPSHWLDINSDVLPHHPRLCCVCTLLQSWWSTYKCEFCSVFFFKLSFITGKCFSLYHQELHRPMGIGLSQRLHPPYGIDFHKLSDYVTVVTLLKLYWKHTCSKKCIHVNYHVILCEMALEWEFSSYDYFSSGAFLIFNF